MEKFAADVAAMSMAASRSGTTAGCAYSSGHIPVVYQESHEQGATLCFVLRSDPGSVFPSGGSAGSSAAVPFGPLISMCYHCIPQWSGCGELCVGSSVGTVPKR